METHKEGRVRTTHSALIKPGEELFKRKKAGRRGRQAGRRQAEAQQKDGLFSPAAADCGAALTHGPTPSGRAVPMQKHPSITERKMPIDSERVRVDSSPPARLKFAQFVQLVSQLNKTPSRMYMKVCQRAPSARGPTHSHLNICECQTVPPGRFSLFLVRLG